MLGYDTFYLEPDAVDEMCCKVCGAQCEVKRSLTEPTGSAEASAGRGHWHDEFSCPHRNKPWHDQALRLVLEIERTPSKRLAELMRQDLDELLHANGCS